MVATVGKKLREARLRNQISIEEASHVTRIRPDQITALEKDDFTNFPSITYARGFLVIYAKYLGVDVSEFVMAFENPNPVGSGDYEYLSNKPAPVNSVNRINWKFWRPLIIGAVVLVGGAVVMDFVINLQRINLGKIETPGSKIASTGSVSSPTPAATPPKEVPAIPSPTPVVALPERVAIPVPQPSATPAATPQMIDNVEVRRAEPVRSSDLTVPPMSSPTPSLERAVTLQPRTKTWVRITKDAQGSPPIFNDWLYPNERPLTFKGAKFWIEIRDKDAVILTRDGQPVPYEPPGVLIE